MSIFLTFIHICLIFIDFAKSYRIKWIPSNISKNIEIYRIKSNEVCKKFYINARNNRSELIVAGDLEEPPTIVKEVQTEESKSFVDDCWEKKLSINDSIEALNSMDEKVEDEVLYNLLYQGKSSKDTHETKDTDTNFQNVESESIEESSPLGIVELNPSYEDELMEESDEEDPLEVDFGMLTNPEISLILTIMREKVENPYNDYIPKAIEIVKKSDSFNYKEDKVEKEVKRLGEISDLFLNLNRNVERDLLDLEWIPQLETKIYRFLKSRNHTLARPTWMEDSLILVLKGQDIPENEINRIQDELQIFINDLSRTKSFSGLSNIGIMISGEDPDPF